uniref:Uncharacterized protein n=1 Tax=Vibrio parahaemolyticus TaxID=670 RepID=A0A1Y1B9V8_VIBPH|nr:hypothetical protein [Vibrio parahaemolyticus]BAX56923.1 hypothetical protein [Vibrio parahaemolyticus]
MCLLERKNNETQHHETPFTLCASGHDAAKRCVSQDYLDHKANADQVQKQMEDARSKNATPLGNVQYLTKTARSGHAIKQDKAPKWLQQEVRIKANQLPLSLVLSMLVQGTNVEVSFDPDVNPNTR